MARNTRSQPLVTTLLYSLKVSGPLVLNRNHGVAKTHNFSFGDASSCTFGSGILHTKTHTTKHEEQTERPN